MPDEKKPNPCAVIAEDAFAAAPQRDPELVEKILNDPRMHDHKDGFLSCIQCGVCTSGCPAARFTEYVPREIARRALEGDVTLLTDDSVWYCFSCYTCQSRCPRHNSVAVINQVIRSLQVESGYAHKHVEMFAEWCGNFYDKGMGGDPHQLFPAIAEAWARNGPRTWTTCSRSAPSSVSVTSTRRTGSSRKCRPSWTRRASGSGSARCARAAPRASERRPDGGSHGRSHRPSACKSDRP